MFVFSPIALSYIKEFSVAFGLTLVSWLSTLVTVFIVALFISLIGRSLFWYTHFYVSVFLYGTAAAAKLILVHTLAKKFYYKVSIFIVYCLLTEVKIGTDIIGEGDGFERVVRS